MGDMETPDSPAPAPAPRRNADLRPVLTRVAWWSILLGLLIEALLLLIRLDRLPQLQPVAEGLGRVTWSLLVCMGLGIGKVLSEDKPFWMGLAGLISAPLAFTAAQAIQRAATELATSVEAGPLSPALIAVAALRGVEYLVLGAILAVIAQSEGRPAFYLLTGLAVGAVFGGILLIYSPFVASLAGVLAWAINELLFPMGYATVLYGAGVISKATGLAASEA